jgi:hypothetical protein
VKCGAEFSVAHADQSPELPGKTESMESASDLAQIDLDFGFSEGFSRPHWKAVDASIKSNIFPEDRESAWRFAARKWLEQLAQELGGGSAVEESDHFLFLSDLGPGTTRTLTTYAEWVLGIIRNCLNEAAWKGYRGKHVVMFYSDPDDYFAYISFYYPEGAHALSSGVFLRQGYAHVALPFVSIVSAQRTLVHELVHNLLCHLPIPLWLNEGLALVVESHVARNRFLVSRALAETHAGFWNEENIQGFWSGQSFDVPGSGIELSYSLAQIFVTVLSEKGGDFIAFIMKADWRDAGQAAALTILDLDLGEVASNFLGPGHWRPQRKAIAEYHRIKPG